MKHSLTFILWHSFTSWTLLHYSQDYNLLCEYELRNHSKGLKLIPGLVYVRVIVSGQSQLHILLFTISQSFQSEKWVIESQLLLGYGSNQPAQWPCG